MVLDILLKQVLIFASIVAASSALTTFGLSKRPPVLPSPRPSYPTYDAQPGKFFKILRFDNDIAPDGSSYRYAYDTENGISAQESGSLVAAGGPEPAIAASGSYQFTSPEGVPVQISYVADENGYQPSGNVLPTPPPIPEAILRSLEFNAAHPEPQATSAPFRKYY